MIVSKAKKYWTLFWMHFAGIGFWGRLASRLASWFVPSYLGRLQLIHFNKKGFISPSATIEHGNVVLGNHIFIGDRVVIYNPGDGGRVDLGDWVRINGDTIIQTGHGGAVKIGKDTHIQPGCNLIAYKASIEIGRDVHIAQGCAFYPYDHGILPGELIWKQPLTAKGNITIEDDVWLGFGVIVLSGVRIGRGAVVGAGSVVTQSIPDGGIAVGVPARVIKMRGQKAEGSVKK
jgi:acetyltransferase-like isoleucine patch superfamily enzyme